MSDALISGIPSYLYAADIHSDNNNQGSIFSPENLGDTAASIGKWTLSAATRAVTSTWNILPTVGNWFGGDFEKADTGEVLRGFDDDLEKYYRAHQDSIDIVGDVAASLIPGFAGIKGVQWGQRALAMIPEGNAGATMARAIGLLPSTSKAYAAAAVADIETSATIFGGINLNVAKAFGTAYAQNALEFAAFETAAMSVMHDSPLFRDHTAGDIVYNSLLGGGLVGGGIMAGISALQTKGAMTLAQKALDKTLNQYRTVTNLAGTELGNNATAKLVAAIMDLAHQPALPTGNLEKRASQVLEDRNNYLWNQVHMNLMELGNGDVELAKSITNSLKNSDFTTQIGNTAYLEEVTRGGFRTAIETLYDKQGRAINKATKDLVDLDGEKILEVIKAQANLRTQILIMRGENAGTVVNGMPEVLSFADKFHTAEEMYAAIKKYGFKVGEDYDFAKNAADVYEAQARHIWARSVKLNPNTAIGNRDIALLSRAYDEGFEATKLLDGQTLSRQELLSYIDTLKRETHKELFAQSKAGLKQASTDTIIARLRNIYGEHVEGMTTQEIQQYLQKYGSNGPGTPNAFYHLGGSDSGVYKLFNRTVVNTDTFATRRFDELVRTLAHEEGHSKTVRYFLANQVQNIPANELSDLFKEAAGLSRRARPGLWISKDPAFVAYRNDPTELLADAYQQIVMNPALQDASKYPMIYKHFRREITPLDVTREVSLAKRDLSDAEIAKWIDTPKSYLSGVRTADIERSLFGLTTEAKDALQLSKDKGLVPQELNTLPAIWETPEVVKLSYRTPAEVASINDHQITAMTYYAQQASLYKDAARNALVAVVGEGLAGAVPKDIPSSVIQNASRGDKASSFLVSNNANYDTAMSYAQQIGSMVNQAFKNAREKIAARFLTHKYNFETNAQSALELGAIRQQLLSTPEKYVLDLNANGDIVGLVLQKQKNYEDAMIKFGSGEIKNEPTREALLDATAKERIEVDSQDVKDFLSDWVTSNREYLDNNNLVRNIKGLRTKTELNDVVYFPPPDPKVLSSYAFVQDRSVVGNGHVRMLWAKNDEELAKLAQKARDMGPEYKVYFKSDINEFKRSLKEYDYDSTLIEQFYDGNLKRTGTAAPFFPVTDGKALMENLLGYKVRAEGNLIREAVATAYAPEIKQLRMLGREYETISSSKFKSFADFLKTKTNNPFDDTIRTMLNVSLEDSQGIWKRVNALVENGFDRVANQIASGYRRDKPVESLDHINQTLNEAGIKVGYPDAVVERLANSTEDKKYLQQIVQKSNAILGTLMLRADPINALNNGIGAAVLTSTELKSVIRAIESGDENIVGRLAQIAKLKVPGTSENILSPTKLYANAYKDWIAYVTGDVNATNMAFHFRQNGWMTTLSEQVKNSVYDIVLDDFSTRGYAKKAEQLSNAAQRVGDFLEKTTGNKFAEEMNRFTAAHMMKSITDIAIEAKLIAVEDASAMINTFVNRTQGCYIAAQRPGVFQGAIGQAIGLFQTYQFNMLQQLFRHISDGNMRNALTMMSMQGSIYGLNGLPAFGAINQYLVGNAAGNKTHQDIYSSVYGAAGREGGDWLMYGIGSNFLLSPDLKINLYSRGDINPRQATVIPTSLSEIPVVGAYGKFFGSLKDTLRRINGGGDVWASIMQGLEHSGISRPLTGIAQAMEAFGNGGKVVSTTTKGDIVGMNDLYTLTTLSRIAGAKPLDEAIARDAMFRVRAYNAATIAKTEDIGAAIKSYVIQGKEPPLEKMDQFAREYVAAGGRQENFMRFYSRALATASTSQVNAIIAKNQSPSSQYMQTMLGGLQMQDMSNSRPLGSYNY